MADPTDAPFDLVVVGDVNPDIVIASPDLRIEFDQHETIADAGEIVLGGSSAITACGAARLGLRVAFAGLVGDDDFGRWCRAGLETCGVDTSMLVVDPDARTGVTVVLQRADDRAIVTSPGSLALLCRRHLDIDRLAAARHVHVGSYFLQSALRPELADLFGELRSGGTSTSLDTNDDPADEWELDDVLTQCDLLFPNAAEARRLTGSDDLDTAVASLAARVGIVAVTLGPEGAMVVSGGCTTRAPAPVVDGSVVDAVGAGDTFDAGFITGHLRGWDTSKSLRLGLGAAALSIRGRGGTRQQGSLDEAIDAGGCCR